MMCAVFATVMAQSGTNSPYSQYGFGELACRGNGHTKGMNGAGIAISDGNRINNLNPASYADVDSLSFLFDVGMTMNATNFNENGYKKNAYNADFDYAVASFRVIRHLGMSFGVVPMANVGYNYSTSTPLSNYDPSQSGSTYDSNIVYSGRGGVHEAFVGMGWTPFKGLSVGFNAGYVWGNISRTVVNTYSDSYVNTLSREYDMEIRNYNVDFGLQYRFNFSSNDVLSLGATYRLGHSMNADPSLTVISNNSSSGVSDTTLLVANNGVDLPAKIGLGLAWNHNTKWRVAFDYTLEQYSKIRFPKADLSNNTYAGVKGGFNDRTTYALGAEYCQNTAGRTFGSRIRYRAGFSYATPYLKINGNDGPKEIAASIGVGIPLITGYTRSRDNYNTINISAQWVNTSMPNAIKENTFRINVGLTFNERWFAKWKFD